MFDVTVTLSFISSLLPYHVVAFAQGHYRVAHALLFLGKNEEAKQTCEIALQEHAEDVVSNLASEMFTVEP